MSDTPQGPDWWQASDDRWYPPPRPEMPGEVYPSAPPTAPVQMGGPQLGGPGMAVGPPSPYGGMPAAPPPGNNNRTALLVTLGVLATAVLVVVIFAVSSGGGDDDDPPVAQPTTTTTEEEIETPPPEEEPPDEPTGQDTSVLEVTEVGWSTFNDFADEPSGAYGFLITNNGDDIISGASITATVKGEDDGIITTDSFTIGIIRPGQTLGYGNGLLNPAPNGIGDVEVRVGENLFPADEVPEGELTVSNVTTTGDEYSMVTTFSVSSTFQVQIDFATPYAVFRDAGGAIIGGASGFMDFIPAGGEQGGELSVFNPIPNVATTEVYVDPGTLF